MQCAKFGAMRHGWPPLVYVFSFDQSKKIEKKIITLFPYLLFTHLKLRKPNLVVWKILVFGKMVLRRFLLLGEIS